MAYANKYKITYTTKTSKTAYLYLQEDGYTGSVIEYTGVDINLQYIPSSDDPYEPIFSSQLGVMIDITDDIANMPNLITTNDRKYFVKLYFDTDLQWTGYTISDDVQLSFSSGRRMFSFNCTDGLGMLKDILLPIPATYDINDRNTILYYIRTCLNVLAFPTSPGLVTVCSFFADGMANRTANPANEPFSQTYLPYRTFLDKPFTYTNCHEVLSNIIKSFGCRLFLGSGARWWVVSVNEFAAVSPYYTEYNSSGGLVGSGNLGTTSQIQCYSNGTSGLYFVDNSQVKLLKKGFNKITCNQKPKSAVNCFSNGNLKPNAGGGNNPSNWNSSYTGTGSSTTLISDAHYESDQWRLIKGSSAGSNVIIYSNGMPKINGGEVLNFSWTYFGQDFDNSRGKVILSVENSTDTYYWGGELTGWTSDPNSGFFYVPNYDSTGSGLTNGGRNDFEFKTTSAPIGGQIFFEFRLEAGTVSFVQVGNFQLTIGTLFSNVFYQSYISADSQYENSIDIPYGVDNINSSPTELGTLVNSSGAALKAWYQQGNIHIFDSLTSLICQLYINTYSSNLINLDGTVASFVTENGYLDASKRLTAIDSDPAQINVSGKSYMLGNTTINFQEDKTQTTLLQISNTWVTATNTYQITYGK